MTSVYFTDEYLGLLNVATMPWVEVEVAPGMRVDWSKASAAGSVKSLIL